MLSTSLIVGLALVLAAWDVLRRMSGSANTDDIEECVAVLEARIDELERRAGVL